ncbi:hypothetical protein LCGC14_2409850, partial [marine sediment metagenome]
MKVAIAGSSGFIGSNLVEACLKKNWEVIGIDNLSTGFDEMADPIRVIDLPGAYSFVKLDINNTSELQKAMSGCSVVFHLAALPRVSFSIDHPIEANQANITGTLSVLQAARLAKVKRVVFSCSSSIFGGSEIYPTPETTRPAPMSPYALHKSTGAEYCRLYSELHGLETVSLIYYNIYGKYQRTGGAYSTIIPAFFEAATNGKSCRIDGDGGQSRDFTNVDNVVSANILSAEYNGKLMGDMFNIANGETYSVNQVYEEIKKLFGTDLKKHHVAPRLGDPRKSHADISKAVKVLGYKPE